MRTSSPRSPETFEADDTNISDREARRRKQRARSKTGGVRTIDYSSMSNAEAKRWIAKYKSLVDRQVAKWSRAAAFVGANADELLAVGNLAVLEAALTFEGDPARIRPWINRIVWQRMSEWIALSTPDRIDPEDLPPDRTEDLIVVAEAGALRRIKGLPENDRAIVALRLQGVPMATIAKEMNKSLKKVERRLDRILAAMERG